MILQPPPPQSTHLSTRRRVHAAARESSAATYGYLRKVCGKSRCREIARESLLPRRQTSRRVARSRSFDFRSSRATSKLPSPRPSPLLLARLLGAKFFARGTKRSSFGEIDSSTRQRHNCDLIVPRLIENWSVSRFLGLICAESVVGELLAAADTATRICLARYNRSMTWRFL